MVSASSFCILLRCIHFRHTLKSILKILFEKQLNVKKMTQIQDSHGNFFKKMQYWGCSLNKPRHFPPLIPFSRHSQK